MIRFDVDEQRWVDQESQALHAQQHAESVRRQQRSLRGTFAVLGACGLVFAAWALGWKDEPVPPQEHPQPSVSAEATPSPSAPSPGDDDAAASATAGATAPAGYTLVVDPAGYSLAVPEGWSRHQESGQADTPVVFYDEPGGDRRLQVFWVEDPDPYGSVQLAEKEAKRNKGYKRKALERLDGGDRAAARLEYTYDSEDHGGTRHVIDERFEGADGRLYAIIVYGQSGAAGPGQERELLKTTLGSFCPNGASCEQTPGG